MKLEKSSERVNGFALAKAAIHTSGLTTLEKLVLIILADHADSSAKSYPSIETITGLVGLNAKSGKQRQKIINIIKALEAKGLLSKAGYHGHSRQYRLNLTVPKQYTTGCTLNNTPRGVHEHTTEYNSNPTHTAVKGYIEVKSTKTKTGRRNYYEVKPEKWMGGQPKNGPMGQGKNGLMGQGKNGPIIDTLQSNGIERVQNLDSTPTPTAEPTEPLANCAQQSPIGSLADEPTALAQSATPTKPPLQHRREASNTYYCEDQQPGLAAAC